MVDKPPPSLRLAPQTAVAFFLGLPVSEALADVKADLRPGRRPGGELVTSQGRRSKEAELI